jgi:hypothetical protein
MTFPLCFWRLGRDIVSGRSGATPVLRAVILASGAAILLASVGNLCCFLGMDHRHR